MMKTVQEHLREIDVDRLIDEYLYNQKIENYELAQMELTGKEIIRRWKENLRRYIQRLLNLTPEPSADGKDSVIFAYKMMKNGFDETTAGLICLQELMDAEGVDEISIYAYEFTKQEEIVGFLVSDTAFTQKEIYEVLADVLYEASFFGYEQERLEDEKQKLEKVIKESEEGAVKTYTLDEVREHLGLEKEPHDEKSDELQRKIRMAEWEFERYWRRKELTALRESLEDEKHALHNG